MDGVVGCRDVAVSRPTICSAVSTSAATLRDAELSISSSSLAQSTENCATHFAAALRETSSSRRRLDVCFLAVRTRERQIDEPN